MSKTHTVRVSSGKYTFVSDGLKIKILRYGEEWHEQEDAFNALQSIMFELDAARVVVNAAREGLASGVLNPHSRFGLAMRRYDALVDDQEKPSEWAAVPGVEHVAAIEAERKEQSRG